MLHTEFIRAARSRWGWFAVADTTGQHLTYGRLLVGAIAFSRLLGRAPAARKWSACCCRPSVGGALANIAAALRRPHPRQPELHDRPGGDARPRSPRPASPRSSRRSGSSKAGHRCRLPSMVFLEDLRKEVGTAQKVAALLQARLTPVVLAASPLLRHGDDGRLAGDDHLLERQHRRAEGRDAHARATSSPTSTSLATDLSDGAGATASSACCRSSTRSASPARCGFRCCRARRRLSTRIRWTRRRSASSPSKYKATC